MKNEQFFIKVKANLTSKMEDIQMPFSQNLNLPNDYESKQINAINWLYLRTSQGYQKHNMDYQM